MREGMSRDKKNHTKGCEEAQILPCVLTSQQKHTNVPLSDRF